MAQLSNSADLPTDAYLTTPSTTPLTDDASINRNKKKAAGIAAAALLLGGSVWAIKQDKFENSENTSNPSPGSDSNVLDEPTLQLPSELDVAGKVTDGMSFDDAFIIAREEVGMAGVFSWHGRWYNTFLKEEWKELSIQQRLDFTEMVSHEHLPVRLYELVSEDTQKLTETSTDSEPTVIEGHINGHRVIGLDFDHDGLIDTLVMDADDGYMYRVVDAIGDQGLDTIYKYDALDGEWVMIEKMAHPFILNNDDFSQNLEERMTKDVVDSILETDDVAPANPEPMPVSDLDTDTEPDDDTIYLTNVEGADDDTYVNNGDVRDMDQ